MTLMIYNLLSNSGSVDCRINTNQSPCQVKLF